jgi:hypothetical protein
MIIFNPIINNNKLNFSRFTMYTTYIDPIFFTWKQISVCENHLHLLPCKCKMKHILEKQCHDLRIVINVRTKDRGNLSQE